MKKITNRFISLALCLSGCLAAHAYSFEVDGISYKIYSEYDKTVEVTSKSSHYTGVVNIPSTVNFIGETYSVTEIGESAFSGCTGLTSVSIPNSVTYIGCDAFSGCTGLTSVSIPNSVTCINLGAFSGCSGLTSVNIPNAVTYIGIHTFSGCSGLTSIVIPNSVTYIGNYAFRNCSSLTSISIPISVTSIESNAFQGCSNLISVSIPNSVTSIGREAFLGCKNLQSIYCMHKVPLECNPSFSAENYMNATLYVLVGTRDAYEKVEPWRNFWKIKEYDFSGVDDITIEDYSDCPVEIYNLSGVKVGDSKENLSPGIYIMRQGRKVEKIMIQ